MKPRAMLMGAALVAAMTLAPVHGANAVCTYTPLASGVPVATTPPATVAQFTQAAFYWNVVAVRPGSGSDWDLGVYAGTGADPVCVAGALGTSSFGGSVVDVVVGDFNANPAGTYYVRASQFSGPQNAQLDWEGTANGLTVNGTALSSSLSSNDVVRVYDVFLNAGFTYTFNFYSQAGTGSHMLLFRNTAGGVYWSGRGGAQFDATGSTTYTAPANGFYGVVITNEAGTAFNYTLGVTQSACGIATTLAPQTPVAIANPGGTVAFDAEFSDWMGLAVRGVASDWDAQLFSLPSGGTAPTCLAGPLATSFSGGNAVDITVGDFNHSPHGYVFGYASAFLNGAPANAEFTGSQNVLTVNGQYTQGTFGAADLAHMYDVYLNAGRTYALSFSTPPGLTLLLFANPGGGAYYAGRTSAAVTTTTSTTYTAPADGWYGLAVLNDGAVAATYAIGVGDCSQVTTLAPGVPAVANTANSYFAFDQRDGYWTAVAVRNTSVDWDLFAGQDSVTSPWPSCTTTILGSSGQVLPSQDFVVGDFNYNPIGRYFVHANQFTAGSVVPGQVQWDSGHDIIIPNDNNLPAHATGAADIIGCSDVFLRTGQTYAFDLLHAGGADLKLLLFRNTGGGVYWSGRASAQFSTTTTQTYTAPSTGYYGVVVVNDNGGVDSYQVRVHTCDPVTSVTALPGYNIVTEPLTVASFTQSGGYWCPVAIRAASPAEDWDIAAYTSGTGGALGTCASGALTGSSFFAGTTDYIIGDFNFVPLGTYYVAGTRFSGTGTAYMQYHPSAQSLFPGAPLQVRHVSSSFLVESWDAFLNAGQTYTVFFTHENTLNAKVNVFQPTGGALWTSRNSAMLESAYSKTFVAPTAGWYAIVVVNDGGSGQFNLTLYNGTTAVDGAPRPDHDALRSIGPNPGHGELRFDYALRDGAAVSFEMLDMAGRVVTRFAPGSKDAGEWSDLWHVADGAGRPLPAGMYFVRMRVGERLVGSRKVALLE